MVLLFGAELRGGNRATVSPAPRGVNRMARAPALAGVASNALHALEDRFGREIAIEADPSLDRVRFQIAPV
jgi:hypothetical protein